LDATKETKELLPGKRKTQALKELGVGHHYILNFNDELNRMEHEIFYERFLRDFLHAQAITVGEDFHFGFQRKGNALWLQERGRRDNILVEIIPALLMDSKPVSSTRIRKLLRDSGNVEEAKRLLGHSFSIEGMTRRGEQMGRKIGFPTLNLETLDQLIPTDGVYCGHVWLEGFSPDPEPSVIRVDKKRLSPAVISIGLRPTFKVKEPRLCIEAHLLDSMGTVKEHYNLNAVFYFEKKLRDMLTFPSGDELAKQITKDIRLAKTYL
jgi:riboflavin kinase/FMN adenylyltransferase